VSLTDRDRKILIMLIPLALAIGYWFLLLAPKRQEATAIKDQLTQAQAERDTAVQRLAGLSGAKHSFAKDYATVIYVGKSIPTSVDMPSLMVQLDRASRGTGILFSSIKAGARTAGTTGTAPATTAAPAATGSQATPAASTSAAAGAAPAAKSSLDSVPLDFEFGGSYFELADFFHRMKRFVRVANDRIVVRGRLMTINSFTFDVAENGSALKATVHATVYLSPKGQGTAAGATSTGPSGATPAPATQSASTASTPPAAAVTVR
jgi:Tfp pilus assembly protein PilO